ncbi:metallophosphoesterase [Roseobacter sp. YSTF-M11]|uniref:Metallophosphoesterase n=1 Tax=Roseobacter insulae TaxID=2859783 RepID=A0A9X1FSF7_9RHOB|nr:metallophosphoesterase [Roseobacter insulae]MBW4706777.1 metallophosphoesterase [Roseobacter insulae]
MKLIHMSDIHLTVPGEQMGGLDPHARFAQALAHVETHHGDATRLIITGDLTHWGEPRAFDALKDAIDAFVVPVRLMIGNHDDRAAFQNAFPEYPKDPSGYVNHFEEVDGLRLIYLDTCAPRTHAGHFGADRCDWLAGALEGADRARLFLHHNPMTLGLPAEDKIALVPEDRSGFRAVLEAHRDRIEYIHFGHVHAPIHGTYCRIPFASVPSTGNQSIPDLRETEMLTGGPLPPAYFVIVIDAGATTIHQIPFAWDGPVHKTGTAWDDWAKPVAAE